MNSAANTANTATLAREMLAAAERMYNEALVGYEAATAHIPCPGEHDPVEAWDAYDAETAEIAQRFNMAELDMAVDAARAALKSAS